eukprot:185469_1
MIKWIIQLNFLFEFVTYDVRDLNVNKLSVKCEITSPNQSNNDNKMKLLWTDQFKAKELIAEILNIVKNNHLFGYVYFGDIIKYIKHSNEFDTDTMDDYKILNTLKVKDFTVIVDNGNGVPCEYYGEQSSMIPECLRIQLLRPNSFLNNTKTIWIMVQKTLKFRRCISKGNTIKDIISKLLNDGLKITMEVGSFDDLFSNFQIIHSKNRNFTRNEHLMLRNDMDNPSLFDNLNAKRDYINI